MLHHEADTVLLPSVPTDILEEAIAWAVRLHSGVSTPEQDAACRAWRAQHPHHEQAWKQVQGVEQIFRSLPMPTRKVAGQTFQHLSLTRTTTRRQALKTLGGCLVLAGTGLLGRLAIQEKRGVYKGFPAEQRTVHLDDGTQLTLNSDAWVETEYALRRRTLFLREGEILVETGRDAYSVTGRRAFFVETAHARLEAIGTRFTVRVLDDKTLVHVTDGLVAFHAAARQSTLLRPGQTALVRKNATHVERVANDDVAPLAWTQGVLVARRMPLEKLLAEISRHHRTSLRCSDEVASLPVSGVFQIHGKDSLDSALGALTRSLSVRVEKTPYGALIVSSDHATR